MVGVGGCSGRADNLHYSRVEDAAPDCGPQRPARSHLCDGRVHDDGARFHSLRQHRTHPHFFANAARISLSASWFGHAAPRPGIISLYAHGRHSDGQSRAAKTARAWHHFGFSQFVPARRAESANRLLGYFLAAVVAGGLDGTIVRAAHHGHQRSHTEREDGQRHQHLQSDAQHRRQLWHCWSHDHRGAPSASPHQYSEWLCESLQPGDATASASSGGGVYGQWFFAGGSSAQGAGRDLWRGAATGGNAVVSGCVQAAWWAISRNAAADFVDEKTQAARRRGGHGWTLIL